MARLEEVTRNNLKLAGRYQPAEFRGDVLYILADHDDAYELDDWRPYVSGRIEVHRVEAGHFELLRPGPLREIAGLLGPRIRAPRQTEREPERDDQQHHGGGRRPAPDLPPQR